MKELSPETKAKLDEAFKERFDGIDVEYARIEASYPSPVREDVIVPEDVVAGSNIELAARLWSLHKADKDESLNQFIDPSDEELQQILDLAAVYEGNWYHSVVVLVKTEPREWSVLEEAVRALPETAGVSLSFRYDFYDDAKLIETLFADLTKNWKETDDA